MGILSGRSNEKPAPVEIKGHPLHCEVCGHDAFWYRQAQLNTAMASFLNFDWLNPSATCYICDGCGYVHWFLPLDSAK
jgi:DNA-directed RNA polymerase subunit M/transcription elongation factor TFIIS